MRSPLFGLVVVLASCGEVVDPGPKGPAPLPANGGRIALECEAHGVRAYEASRTLISGVPLRCTAHVADRTGAPVKAAAVTFLVEAGRVTSAGTTSEIGTVEVLHETATPLPLDTDPGVFTWTPASGPTETGELLVPTWMAPDRWNENPSVEAQIFTLREPRRPDPFRLKPEAVRFINNPRDNLVAMIAIVDGEEAFTDTNANGTFDQGEAFVDLTEPFVDANDNGTWDSFEQFFDVNGNRQWDGRNGRWDASTKLWVQERFLWTGVPEERDALLVVPGVAGHRATVVFSAPSVALFCPGAGPTCSRAQTQNVTLYLADPWFNPVARVGATDDCDAGPTATLPVVVASVRGPGASALWPAGEFLSFQVADKRDGTSEVARRVPALEFTANLTCHFTGHVGGQKADLVVGSLRGTIE